MKTALQSLTLYAYNLIKDRLAKVLNHTDIKHGVILHDGNRAYPFLVTCNSRHAWQCRAGANGELGRCWQECHYGIPCSHILIRWLGDIVAPKFKTVEYGHGPGQREQNVLALNLHQ